MVMRVSFTWKNPISYPESSGFLVSGATPGRLWGHRILLPQDFCGKTMETVTEQPIKKIEFFRCPQSLPGVAPLTKKPEDSGYEIGKNQSRSQSPRVFWSAPRHGVLALTKRHVGSGNEIVEKQHGGRNDGKLLFS